MSCSDCIKCGCVKQVAPGPDDLHYLQSIYRQLKELSKDVQGLTLGSEILADNLDWLDCFIEKHGGKTD